MKAKDRGMNLPYNFTKCERRKKDERTKALNARPLFIG